MIFCPISVTTLLFSITIFWKLIDGSYIGDVAINCGYHGDTTAQDGRQWFGDIDSNSDKSMLQSRGHSRSSIPHQKSLSADPIPYMTARTSATQFYYSFQVNPGQKFIRLHFYPSSSYQGFENSLDFFTVKAGPFTLLRNFSASLAADAMGVNYIIKEFCVNVEENEFLNLTFTPTRSAKGKNYHAYVNGIEIITMPTGLYFTPHDDLGARVVGHSNRYFHIDNSTALETVQRLNIGGSSISPVEDFGMFRRWNADSNYLLGSKLQPVNHLVPWTNTGLYTFSVPQRIFHTSWQTAKNGRTDNAYYNFTWKIPVDLGFGYLVRLHFCDFAPVEREGKGIKVNILIDNQVAETVVDVIRLSGRNGVPIYRDYMVMVKGDEVYKYDLFVALQSSDELAIQLLRGLEIFKLSNLENNLASKNEVYLKHVSAASWNLKTKHFLSAFDRKNTIVTAITILLILLNLIVSKLRQNWEESTCREEENFQLASRKQSCRTFSLAEIVLATQNFSNAFLIGKGGFGYVYKGFIRGGSETVAIKRLKSNSKQGAREFWMEIETLSSIRHKHLVSLIGYCNEYQEMILVYEYMPCGTLADNLYEIGRNGEDGTCLSWEQRLSICIGAARGLDYLHTGIEYEIIHRDVKDSNILLDKNFAAKISDFGLSKLRNVSESQDNLSTKVKGTPGFVDPDYFMTHKPTTKADVYAFGVVMLVVLCGRPAIDRSIPWEPRSLLSLFQEHMRKGNVNGIVDPSMQGKISTESLNEFIKSLENCLHIEPRERPTMSEVATSLEWALKKQQSTISCNLEEAPAATSASGQSSDHEFVQSFRSSLIQEEGFTSFPTERITGEVIDDVPQPPPLHRGEIHQDDKDVAAKQKPSKKERLISKKEKKAKNRLIFSNGCNLAFDLEDLLIASAELLGKGSFGTTYKAELEDATTVAVKRLNGVTVGKRKFELQMAVVGNISHENLASLRAYYCSKNEKLMVYDYYVHGSVSQMLHGKRGEKRIPLDWESRLRIAIGTARGIAHIHMESRGKLVHGNIKASNIFLNSQEYGCISDLGLATSMTPIVGTGGYRAPEVTDPRKVSQASDVYSYGVLLLEILTGKSPIHSTGGGEVVPLVGWVNSFSREEWTTEVFDVELLRYPNIEEEMVEMLRIGMTCVARMPEQRPKMIEVVKMVEDIRRETKTEESTPAIQEEGFTSSPTEAIFRKTRKQDTFLEFPEYAHFPHFTLHQIKEATRNFLIHLRQGSSWVEYRGCMPGGLEFTAVKRYHRNLEEAREEFYKEMMTLSKIKHINIVPILGYCSDNQEMILVQEYMSSGALDRYIRNMYENIEGPRAPTPLTWEQRLRICKGAACGLECLHSCGIIHGDVNCSNILLDKNMVAKIADIGLSKMFSESESHISTLAVGSRGYLDPAYFVTDILANKRDVYSFGEVMLAVLSGKSPSTREKVGFLAREDYENIVDPYLRDKISTMSFGVFIKASKECLQREPEKRPTMSQLVAGLSAALLTDGVSS